MDDAGRRARHGGGLVKVRRCNVNAVATVIGRIDRADELAFIVEYLDDPPPGCAVESQLETCHCYITPTKTREAAARVMQLAAALR
jgi:hypothetical protein